MWHAHVNGLIIGILLGIAVSFGELYLFKTRIRRLRFSLFIICQTLFYVAAINASLFGVVTVHRILAHNSTLAFETSSASLAAYFGSDEFLTVNLYTLVLVFAVGFLRVVNRMLGQNALFLFLTGKYHRPVEEERVFMFLDIKASTTIAEKIGHTRYHAFLNDFFYDITPAIIESKGEIYRYVGDEVIVTWPRDRGLRDANCIHCYFRIAKTIAGISAQYEKNYGFTPGFRAGFHIGMVTSGLIGDIKRDVAFNGDTVNTTARIRSECTTAGRDLLFSGDLLNRLQASDLPALENIGRIKLRGKEEEIELYSVKDAA